MQKKGEGSGGKVRAGKGDEGLAVVEEEKSAEDGTSDTCVAQVKLREGKVRKGRKEWKKWRKMDGKGPRKVEKITGKD